MTEAQGIRPNFFILGAPKCGTTALAEYLATHPEVLFSVPKEAKFFHTDFARVHRLVHGLDEYLALFGAPEVVRRTRAVGEGTVWYLYSRTAVPNILEFNPAARFIVMVRNPIEIAQSLHSQLLYGGEEDVESFETAWRLQESRGRGENLPRYCLDPKSLQYERVARLGEQIERLFGLVPRDRVQVIVFDDFVQDTPPVYREALEFLGASDDGRSEFPIVNPNKVVHRTRAAALLRFGAAVKRKMGIRRSLGVWGAVSHLVSKPARRQRLDEAFRAELAEVFRPDVEMLSSLIGRDLTHWLRAADSTSS